MEDCCKSQKGKMGNKVDKGFLSGLLYGILPHSFCIAFIVFSVLGVTVASAFIRKFLLIPNLFEFLIGLSFVFVLISAIVYLKRKKQLSVRGIRNNREYLAILFGTTIAVNALLFLVVFPKMANVKFANSNIIAGAETSENLSTVTLQVTIPCSGHAPLIVGEIRGIGGVRDVKFTSPNLFSISYSPKETDLEKILKLDIFKTYPAIIK